MAFKHYPLKIEITVDGNGWDKPISIRGDKRPGQPDSFTLRFSNKNGKNTSRIGLNDVLRVFAGFGSIGDKPLFTGFIADKSNKNPIDISFASYRGLYEHDLAKIDDYNNLDGLECGYAIQKVAESYDYSGISSPLTYDIQGTEPRNVVPTRFRFQNYSTKLNIIKALNDLCIDESHYPDSPRLYSLYEIDNVLYQRKIPPVDGSVDASYNFGTIDNISSNIKVTPSALVNKATVIGGQYTDALNRQRSLEATHSDDSFIRARRMFWRTPITDNTLTTYDACLNRAKQEVEANKFRNIRSSIKSISLLHAIPNISLIEVEKSRFDLDGFHLITDISISLGGKRNAVIATLNTKKPLIGNYL